MRFVLYFLTWAFIVQTVGNLVRGEVDQFLTGLFLSGLMVWWSVTVRNKRKRKLSGNTESNEPKPQGNWDRAWGELKAESSALVSRKKSKVEPQQAVPVQATPFELSEEPSEQVTTTQTAEPVDTRPQDDSASPAVIEEPTQSEDSSVQLADSNPVIEERVEPELQPEPSEPAQAPERPLWTDSQGRALHVGAKVSFLANSRGQSVSIPGVLLGEREGKALIEVASGALLPKNDYSIPWNVVSLVD
jgi:hypothetical protein